MCKVNGHGHGRTRLEILKDLSKIGRFINIENHFLGQ